MLPIPYCDENPTDSYPFLTVMLIALNGVLFFLTPVAGGLEATVARFGFTAQAMVERPYVLVSSVVLHANLIHLLSNVWFLWLFGDNVEDTFGNMPFLVLFILAGIIGNFTHAALNLFQSDLPVIGASGAVAGVMGAYMVRFPNARIRCIFLIIIYPLFMRIRAIWFIGLWITLEFIYAFLNPNDYVAHWAHIGGFIFGAVWAYGRRDKSQFPRGFWGRRH